MRHRRLLDDRHGPEQSARTRHQLASVARFVNLSGNVGKEVEEDAAKDLILLENLVRVEALFVAESAEFHGFGHDNHIHADLCGGILDIVGYAVDEERYMVEQ